jgi:sigma-B regulation protein RsbU (phosphoserine phosphatase)
VKRVDTRSSLRIAVLLEMLEDVSRAESPDDAVRAYAARLRRVRPLDAFAAISVRDLKRGDYRLFVQFRAETIDPEHVAQADDEHRIAAIAPANSGLLGIIAAQSEPLLLHDLDLSTDPALGTALGDMHSCIAVPIFDAGRIDQWWVMFRRDAGGYGIDDLEDDLLIGNLFGSMTQNLVSIQEIQALNDRLNAQFEEVARVQRALLPEHVPSIPGFTFAASYLPSDKAGGDYYDFFHLNDGRIGIILADVSGHGPAAATVMAMFRTILHAVSNLTEGPALALRFANSRLCETRINGGFITAVLCVLDPRTRELTIARAGHPLPRVRKMDGRARELEGPPAATPLGIDDTSYTVTELVVALDSGDTVVLFTDGITETFDTRRNMFGVEGIDRALASFGGGAEQAVQGIQAAAKTHSGSEHRSDDQTLVAFGVDARLVSAS